MSKERSLMVSAMDSAGFKTMEIAKEIGVTRQTVDHYKKVMRNDLSRLDPVHVATVKKRMEHFFLQRSVTSLDAMTPAKFEKASLKDLAIVSGITHEHSRLAAGESTSAISLDFSTFVDRIEQRRQERYKRCGMKDEGGEGHGGVSGDGT